jgi:hypothetical protein
VADAVIAARDSDGAVEGARTFPLDQLPTAPDAPYGHCTWEPTPPLYAAPWGVAWGNVTPFLLTDAEINATLAPAPPACDSPQYVADHREVYDLSYDAPESVRDAALWWDDHGWSHPNGTVTTTSLAVAGIFAPILREWTLADGLSTPRSARAFAAMHASMADSFISVWRSKYTWWTERPITYLAAVGHEHWEPFIASPSFPGYPSGHSGQGGSSAAILGHLFPGRAALAESMGLAETRSREIAGVHPRFDDDAGYAQGVRVAQRYLAWLRADGAGEFLPPQS